MSNLFATLKSLKMIMTDASPKEIVDAIKGPYFDPESQHYAVICMSKLRHWQTYSDSANSSVKRAVTAIGISVPGNNLTNTKELKAALDAAVKGQKASLPIKEVLMLTLEAGAKTGGDK